MSHSLLLIPIGLVTGVLSGLLGVGGGFLLVPCLYLLGWPLHMAIGTSLVYVTVLGLGGTWAHFRARNLDVRLVAALALPAIAGAQLGAHGTTWLPGWVLDVVFAGCTLVAAWQMTRPAPDAATGEPDRRVAAALGLGVGVLSGLLGVGGGLFLVPGQVRWLGVPLKRAVGNSLAAIVLTGASGIVGHALLGNIEAAGSLWLVGGGLVGLRIGLWLLARTENERLRRVFLVFLALVGLYMGAEGVIGAIAAHGAPPAETGQR